MSKYNSTNVVGESWVRSNKVICTNLYGENPSIYYAEEELFNFTDGKVVNSIYSPMLPAGEIFTTENANTEFQLISPITDELLNKTATYEDVYILLHSLYFHLVSKRDENNNI